MGPKSRAAEGSAEYLIIRCHGKTWATIPARPWAEAKAEAIDIIGGPAVWATLAEK